METGVVSKDEFNGRCQVDDERFARDQKDIEELDRQMQEVTRLTLEISQLVKQNNERMENHENRLAAIEGKPSIWLDRIVAGILGAVIVVVVNILIYGG